jgi:hypothetical protein
MGVLTSGVQFVKRFRSYGACLSIRRRGNNISLHAPFDLYYFLDVKVKDETHRLVNRLVGVRFTLDIELDEIRLILRRINLSPR